VYNFGQGLSEAMQWHKSGGIVGNLDTKEDYSKILKIGVDKVWKGKANYAPFYQSDNLDMVCTGEYFLRWSKHLILAPPGEKSTFTSGRIHQYIETVHGGEPWVTASTVTNTNRSMVELILCAITFNLLVNLCGRHGTEGVQLKEITETEWLGYYQTNYHILSKIMRTYCREYF